MKDGPIRTGLEEALDAMPAPDPARLALARETATSLDGQRHSDHGLVASLIDKYMELLDEMGVGNGSDDDSDPLASFAPIRDPAPRVSPN